MKTLVRLKYYGYSPRTWFVEIFTNQCDASKPRYWKIFSYTYMGYVVYFETPERGFALNFAKWLSFSGIGQPAVPFANRFELFLFGWLVRLKYRLLYQITLFFQYIATQDRILHPEKFPHNPEWELIREGKHK